LKFRTEVNLRRSNYQWIDWEDTQICVWRN